MSQIHSTAIIETGAVLADTVKIGPYCVVGADVKLGANVELIKAHALTVCYSRALKEAKARKLEEPAPIAEPKKKARYPSK